MHPYGSSRGLVVALIALCLYLCGANLAGDLTGKWPGPLWYSYGIAGLAGLGAYARGWRDWVVAGSFGLLLALTSWYFRGGHYWLGHVLVRNLAPDWFEWAVPRFAFVCSVFLARRHRPSFDELGGALLAFTCVATAAWVLQLLLWGLLWNGNYDDYGVKLGLMNLLTLWLGWLTVNARIESGCGRTSRGGW